jgi:undecaprenyl-diphosphatase
MLAVVVLGLGPMWLGWLLLLWAPLVGLARVAMGVHYLSDVLAGMFFGLVIGCLILLVIRFVISPI